MKRIVSIIAIIAALGIAGLSAVRERSSSSDKPRNAPSAESEIKPTKTGRIDDSHHPDRFKGLSDDLKQIALDLEESAINWNRKRPPHQSVHKDWREWDEFARARVKALDTPTIQQLLEWLDRDFSWDYVTELTDYRQSLVFVWASRDPAAARKRVLAVAGKESFLGTKVDSWRNGSLEECADDYHLMIVGHASVAAAEAWRQFEQDLANPDLANLTDPGTTIPEVFHSYAAQAPSEAWQRILTTEDERICAWLVDGYTAGAPNGQDWRALGDELTSAFRTKGFDPGEWVAWDIAGRWMLESPEDAFAWIVTNGSEESVIGRPAEDDTTSRDLRLQIALFDHVYGSNWNRVDAATQVLNHLAQNGNEDLVASILRDQIGDYLQPMDLPLLESITYLAPSPNRDALFSQMAGAVRARGNNLSSPLRLNEPNICAEAVLRIADQLKVSPELRAETEAAFQKLEAAELKALEEEEAERHAKNHPETSQ